jgi:hypothetical protein
MQLVQRNAKESEEKLKKQNLKIDCWWLGATGSDQG